MRALLFILFILVGHLVNAQTISDKCLPALEQIQRGHIHYGVEEIKKYLKTNDLVAQYYIAVCYEHGIVVEQNLQQSFFYYRKAAERGLPDAMYKLALFYKEGIVVPADNAKSEEWMVRYEKKGGKFLLPDFVLVYNEGIKHPENYALNPNGSVESNSGNMIAMQNNGSINSNNTVGSNNQTINNITIVQATPTQPVAQNPTPKPAPSPTRPKSDVDQNIPTSSPNNENAFALIIANENYQDVAKVPNAINDGEVFAEYCKKTLGLPASNVVFVKDATYNNIKREINKLSQIANAYNGTAKIMFYYAGHGVPNEATKDAFLLPVDGYGTDTSTGYSLNELYAALGSMPAEQVVVLLDACFSGSQRGDGMLASARGVAIKAKPNKVDGKMVVISAAQGDETAYPYEEQGHGLFTYFLLKKLKETKGTVSLGDLASYIKDNVGKKSIVVNGKSQTSNVNPSASLGDSWKTWTLK